MACLLLYLIKHFDDYLNTLILKNDTEQTDKNVSQLDNLNMS